MSLLQSALSVFYPDQCVLCRALVDRPGALCAVCWRDTPFISGHVCDSCGTGLPWASDGGTDHCDDCLAIPRPWAQGRAAMAYEDAGRRLVLALKHGDRTDLAAPAASWMAKAGRPVLETADVLIPVPIHWSRLLRRRYNQTAEIVRALSGATGVPALVDALRRITATPIQDGLSVEGRFANVAGAISANTARAPGIAGRRVVLIDDVMTSGATLAAATEACHATGAGQVSVLVLARARKRT